MTCARLTPFNLVTPINSASMETPKHCSSGLGGPVQGHWLTLFAQHPSYYPVPISKSDCTHVQTRVTQHFTPVNACLASQGLLGKGVAQKFAIHQLLENSVFLVLMSALGELAHCLKVLPSPFSCSIKPLTFHFLQITDQPAD